MQAGFRNQAMLWFDVEIRYDTTEVAHQCNQGSCGLM